MSRRYPNYNVRTRASLRTIRDWRDQSCCDMKVFENFDGGGFNFFIVEFMNPGELDAFMEEFDTIGRSWVETGIHHSP